MAKGRSILVVAVLFAGHVIEAQQTTTNTNCNVYGNNVNCTSTTTDNSAQQRQAYETGQQIGNALGTGMAAAMQAHAFSKGVKKYCAAHPGEEWQYYSKVDGHILSSGHCPSDEDKGVVAANLFMSKHKDFIRNQTNSQVMVAYLEAHKLDPREEKSYERAYKDLKKDGKLELYAK